MIVDANILLRCVFGAGLPRLAEFARRGGATLETTEHTVAKCWRVIERVAEAVPLDGARRLGAALTLMVRLAPETYAGERPRALRRLREGGVSDWPVLAAALARETDIWSDDVDFFGVGVGVWSSRNVALAFGEAVHG